MMNYISYHPQSLVLFKASNPHINLVFKFSPFQIVQQQPYPSSRNLEISFSALLGVKFIKEIPFLVVASQSFPCCTFPGQTIYEIKKIEWIPIVNSEKASQKMDECEEEFQDISKLFEDGHHYYCEKYQIHKPYHLNTLGLENSDQQKFYSQFIWNEGIMTGNGKFDILKKWCKPIIQGYVEGFQTTLPNKQKIMYNIISRRSNKKAGTRYYARGIDDKGNVANFTQTEQLIFIGELTISQLQIRGSVPAFFQQLGVSGLNGQLLINRNEATTQKAFELHFEKLRLIYGRILCANLLSIKKSQEEKLTIFYETLVDNYAPPYVKYKYFDFHDQCKNNQFENSKVLIDKIKSIIDSFGYYLIDNKQNKLLKKQNGTIRTNCLDCLDRTNYIQSRIALSEFQTALCQVNPPSLKDLFQKDETFKNKIENSSQILKKFNYVWAENGDSISLHYTGIGSTHTDITKTGKRTFKGTVNHKMRSLMRFFTQFSDTKKHEAIHNLVSDSANFRNSLAFEEPVTDLINTVILSYEVVMKEEFDNQNSFSEHYISKKNPDIVVIGGYVPTESSWFKQLFKNHKHEELQIFIAEKIHIIRRLGYEIFCKMQNPHSCLLIFGNQRIIKNITQIKNETVEKFKDNMLICKFHAYQVSLVFSMTNCHSLSALKSLVEKSFDEAFQKNKLGKAKSSSILQHNYRTILGNIGSTTSFSAEKIESMQEKMKQMEIRRDLKGQAILNQEALDADEFNREYLMHPYLKNYMEGPMSFIPRQNRIIFWNQQNLIIKVFEYGKNKRKRCVFGLLGYDIKDISSK